jgi:hypothetical protein
LGLFPYTHKIHPRFRVAHHMLNIYPLIHSPFPISLPSIVNSVSLLTVGECEYGFAL